LKRSPQKLRRTSYTVKAGDTFGGIAKDHLGSAGVYMKIFELLKIS
jgi:nucleoid-associated protein YgaU